MKQATYKAILFDKDGTLFSFTHTWALFCDRMFERLAPDNLELQAQLAQTCGYDQADRTFLTGSLIVCASAHEVNTAWADILPDHSLEDVERLNLELLADLPLAPTCDLHEVLGRLKQQGFVLGVATNDYYAGAREQLEKSDILSLFDFVCGSDSGYGSKPGPGMIHGFCDETNIDAASVIFVGDSKHDMDCGANAAVGLCVGVLTGPADAAALGKAANVILPSIEMLPEYLSTLRKRASLDSADHQIADQQPSKAPG